MRTLLYAPVLISMSISHAAHASSDFQNNRNHGAESGLSIGVDMATPIQAPPVDPLRASYFEWSGAAGTRAQLRVPIGDYFQFEVGGGFIAGDSAVVNSAYVLSAAARAYFSRTATRGFFTLRADWAELVWVADSLLTASPKLGIETFIAEHLSLEANAGLDVVINPSYYDGYAYVRTSSPRLGINFYIPN